MPVPSSSPLPDASRMDLRVRAALLDLVFADQPLSLGAGWVFSLSIALVLHFTSNAAFHWWWLAGMTITLAARWVVAERYRRTPPDVTGVAAWEQRFFAGSTFTAVLWGLLGWYAYPYAPPGLTPTVVLLIGGVVATSSRTIACQLPAYRVYAIVSGLPLIVLLFLKYGDEGAIVGAFVALYTLLMIGLGRSFRDSMARTLRLQLENADLAAQLRRDITARESVEIALRASEERLRFAQYALDHARDLVAIFDRDGNLLHVSNALCRHSGRPAEELARMKIWDGILTFPGATYLEWWDKIREVGAVTFEADVISRQGECKPVEVNATHVEFNGREAVCAIARDLAPRRAAEQEKMRLQQQLQETQRLESLGVLAGGIAHDFNNLLTAILGNATLARDCLDQPATLVEMLGQIETASNQAAGLCRQMLAYAGRGQLQIQPIDLSSVVAESAKLLEMTVGHRAQLKLELTAALPAVLADLSQLRQVVLNLVHNSAEAMNRPDGRIVVTTQPVRIEPSLVSSARIRTDITAGSGVALVVTDNGAGMSPDTLNHIFEPFFTTKFTGRGLGLPAVLGIVRSHHALLHVESTPGQGSTFRVTFSAAAQPVTPKLPAVAAPSVPRQGRVLIVEDEESVRLVARQVLERLGFSVEIACDGPTALTLVSADPMRFSVLLIDMTMPGMDGATTLQEIRRRGALAPAIVMSGLSEQQVRDLLGSDRADGFLSKPFDVLSLRSKVEAVLESSARRPGAN